MNFIAVNCNDAETVANQSQNEWSHNSLLWIILFIYMYYYCFFFFFQTFINREISALSTNHNVQKQHEKQVRITGMQLKKYNVNKVSQNILSIKKLYCSTLIYCFKWHHEKIFCWDKHENLFGAVKK